MSSPTHNENRTISTKRRPSFSLRTLFAGAAICSIALGYLMHNVNIVRQRNSMRVLMREPPYAARTITLYNDLFNGTTLLPVPVPWIRRWFGDYGERTILYSPGADPDGTILKKVERLFPEAYIFGAPGRAKEPPPFMI